MSDLESTAIRIDLDRRKEVSALSRSIATGIGQAVTDATHSIRLGHNPEQAARRAIVGDTLAGVRGLVPAVATSMMLANLKGQRRMVLEARAASKRVDLSRKQEKEERRKTEEALALLAFLGIDQEGIGAMRDRWITRATPIVNRMAGVVTERVAYAAQNAAGRTGTTIGPFGVSDVAEGSTPRTAAERANLFRTDVQEELDKVGLGKSAEIGFTGWANAAVSIAFEGGRLDDSIKLPAVSELLWGFHYSAILDNKTSRLCRSLDGMVMRLGDPAIDQWKPPNHFHCRSLLIPVWQSSELKEPAPIVPDLPAATWARFIDLKEKFLRYL